MRLVMVSDTHGKHQSLDGFMPEGDVLLHGGDLCERGSLKELRSAADWLKAQKTRYTQVLTIAGNHDFSAEAFYKEGREDVLRDIFHPVVYLRDSGILIEGKYFYGSPWTPTFFNWAFNADRGPTIKQYWDMIPERTDVLITHGPPYRVLDYVGQNRVGCEDLRDAVDRVKPVVHLFGHIHCAAGEANGQNGTKFFNAAILDEGYCPVNVPRIFDL
jgi:Icc-related predicted phosphoesterase